MKSRKKEKYIKKKWKNQKKNEKNQYIINEKQNECSEN